LCRQGAAECRNVIPLTRHRFGLLLTSTSFCAQFLVSSAFASSVSADRDPVTAYIVLPDSGAQGFPVDRTSPIADVGLGTPPVTREVASMSSLSTCLLRHWIHSHEEDTTELRVYRPAEYAFPPARGRMGLEFRRDGELVYYGISPSDGSDHLPGRWSLEPPNRVRIDVTSERIEPFMLEVVSCSNEVLTVKR
jgi:hypothetical protein